MTDSTPAPRKADAPGVVDPLRIPGAAAARRIWAGMPNLARAFVVLAAVDVIVRALGLFSTNLYLDLASPLTWFSAFFPHDALILLPAIVILRRQAAVESTPLVVRGAILVALVELLNTPLRGLVSGNPADPVTGPTIISILAILLTAAGWYDIARGLRGLNPVRPKGSTAGLANLVAGGIGLGALVTLLGVLYWPGTLDPEDPSWGALIQLNSAMSVLQTLAFAYLARVVVLGTDDVLRPIVARYTATSAVTLLAVGGFITAIAGLIALTEIAFAQSIGLGSGPLWAAAGWLTGPVPMTVFVVAFGLGLADPSGTIERAVQFDEPASS